MSESPLATAQSLIRQKRYREARRILVTLKDNETARRWLAKLDEVAPEAAESEASPRASNLLSIVASIIALLAVAAVSFVAGRETMRAQSPQAQFMVVTSTPMPTLVAQAPALTDTPIPTVTPECNIGGWWRETEPFVTTFLDTAEVAGATSRMSASAIVLELRRLHREYEAREAPACARYINYMIRNGMDDTVEGFTDFIADNSLAGFYLENAANEFYSALQALQDVPVAVTELRLVTFGMSFGFDAPNEATATEVFISYQNAGATTDAMLNRTSTPTPKP